jgi:hypothetical protein
LQQQHQHEDDKQLIESFVTDITRLAAENDRLIDGLPPFLDLDSSTQPLDAINKLLQPAHQQAIRQRIDQSINSAEQVRTELNQRLQRKMDEYLCAVSNGVSINSEST